MIEKSDKRYLIIGMIGTFSWVLVLGFILFCLADISWAKMKAMDPNEWGDFLAGFFAPLAFFWFVIAFLQQGAELRASVNQFAHQAKALKATNSLEARKLAMAEWDSIHLEMSGILSSYLFQYSVERGRKQMQNRAILETNSGQKSAAPEHNPAEFVQMSWEQYSQGDKNTFFRTVFTHSKYAKKDCLETFFADPAGKRGRYLNLKNRLREMYQDEGLINNLLMTEEMLGVADYLSGLNNR